MDMNSISVRFLIVAASCALIWFGVRGLESGAVRVKGGRLVVREDSPFNYWLFVWTYFIAGIGDIMFVVFGG